MSYKHKQYPANCPWGENAGEIFQCLANQTGEPIETASTEVSYTSMLLRVLCRACEISFPVWTRHLVKQYSNMSNTSRRRRCIPATGHPLDELIHSSRDEKELENEARNRWDLPSVWKPFDLYIEVVSTSLWRLNSSPTSEILLCLA